MASIDQLTEKLCATIELLSAHVEGLACAVHSMAESHPDKPALLASLEAATFRFESRLNESNTPDQVIAKVLETLSGVAQVARRALPPP